MVMTMFLMFGHENEDDDVIKEKDDDDHNNGLEDHGE